MALTVSPLFVCNQVILENMSNDRFSFPSLRSRYTATLPSTCFWIFLPSRIQPGEETDVGKQRLNQSSLSLFRFSELNKALGTNEYNWWRVFIFLPQELQTRSDLSSARNILVARIHQTSSSALRAETSSRYQSDPPENTQKKQVPAWPVISQLWFPERHFSANGISLRLGEVQMKFYERSLQALLSSAPRGFAARSRVLERLASLSQIGELARRLFNTANSNQWEHDNVYVTESTKELKQPTQPRRFQFRLIRNITKPKEANARRRERAKICQRFFPLTINLRVTRCIGSCANYQENTRHCSRQQKLWLTNSLSARLVIGYLRTLKLLSHEVWAKHF